MSDAPPLPFRVKSPLNSLTPGLCLWRCVYLHVCVFSVALYGYFGAVGRLTLHTLPSIVKDWSTLLFVPHDLHKVLPAEKQIPTPTIGLSKLGFSPFFDLIFSRKYSSSKLCYITAAPIHFMVKVHYRHINQNLTLGRSCINEKYPKEPPDVCLFFPVMGDLLCSRQIKAAVLSFDTKNRSYSRNANIYQNLGKTHQLEHSVRPKKEWKTVMCACLLVKAE